MKKFNLFLITSVIMLFATGCAPLKCVTPNIYVSTSRDVFDKEQRCSYQTKECGTELWVNDVSWDIEAQEYKVNKSYITDCPCDNPAIYTIGENYVVLLYLYPGKYSIYTRYTMKYHKKDILLYLNDETGKADVLYESKPYERIFYGTQEYVIIYNWNYSEYHYINISDGSVYKTQEAHIKNDEYYKIEYDDSGNIVCIQNGWFADRTVDTLYVD